MRLSENQKKIISSALLQADATVASIGKETGFRPHVVRHALDYLKEQKVLAPYACIDLQRLGLDDHCAYFTYLCDTESDRQKLIAILREGSQIAVSYECAGEFQYNLAPYVRRLDAVDQLFNTITKTCRGTFINKSVATRIRWALFRPKFLSAHPAGVNAITFGDGSDQGAVDIDAMDRKILWQLSQPTFRSYAHVARLVHIPSSTLESRVQRLKRAGILRGQAYTLDNSACGIQSYRLLICHKQSSERLAAELFQFAAGHPNVMSFVHCVGNWDFELGIRTERPEQVHEVVQTVYTRYKQDIASLKLLTMLRRLKFNLFPFAVESASNTGKSGPRRL